MNNKRGKTHSINFLPKNQKGQELSTTTVILLILGVLILVILIIGFSTGWALFQNLIFPTNVDSVVSDCSSACGLNQQYSFCSASRELRVNEDKLDIKTSCAVMAVVSQFQKYSIQQCPSITCNLPCADIVIGGKSGVIVTIGTKGTYNVTALANDNLSGNQICLVQ